MLVSGRGLLHLTVLIETMRREGFELYIGCPQVIEKTEGGERQEPFELVDIELPEEYSGAVIDMLGMRKGMMKAEEEEEEDAVTCLCSLLHVALERARERELPTDMKEAVARTKDFLATGRLDNERRLNARWAEIRQAA